MAKQAKRSRKPETTPETSPPSNSTPKEAETTAKRAKRSPKSEEPSRSNPKLVKKAEESQEIEGESVIQPVNEDEVAVNVVVDDEDEDVSFVGKPVPANEAREKWPHRYETKARVKILPETNTEDAKEIYQARCHYTKAIVDGTEFKLNEHAYVKAAEGQPDYIARIVELFETVDKQLYFSAQWFFRAADTVIKSQAHLIDPQRVFYSEMKDDNPLNSIVSKVTIVQLPPDVDPAKKEKSLKLFDYYYDMQYSKPVTFTTLHTERVTPKESPLVPEDTNSAGEVENNIKMDKSEGSTLTLLDLYAGCGAMSTGLCYGTGFSGVKLETKWAVDMNKHACESLKINHPETEVRNESAEDFFTMLKEWEKLCGEFGLIGSQRDKDTKPNSEDSDSEEIDEKKSDDDEEFEIGKFLAVCFGDPNKTGKKKLHFKVRWKGYSSKHDSWEPYDSLSEGNCKEAIKEFVIRGYHSRMLPLRGDVDFICGGPPCQGISGHNRFRNYENPLQDEKNHQLVVYMDIIDLLKPKFVLMENVVDIIKFANGILGYHAVGRLVAMNYQTRLGIMAAGSYGVSQCRYRLFLWGASTMMNLPQFPLPTHEVVGKGVVPNEFKDCVLGFDNDESHKLEKSIFLGDAISDLPEVTNYNGVDEMEYGGAPRTSFQKFIRMRKQGSSKKMILYDHRPLELNEDDFARVCLIPKFKGANFRNLQGVLVDEKDKVYWDTSVPRVKLPSGKQLVPNYCMTFVRGTSKKPFGRLGMDSVIKTVVGRAEPHNQALLHPNQDRVLTIRENARLQGFPDHYRLCGPVKERYLQVGNAVSFAVSTALGYTLARAIKGENTSKPLMLPVKFPDCLGLSTTKQESE